MARRRSSRRKASVPKGLVKEYYKKKRRQRKRRAQNKVMQWRLGMRNPGGGKPVQTRGRVINAMTPLLMYPNPVVTSQYVVHAFPINDFKNPGGVPATNHFDHTASVLDKQYREYDAIKSQGYERAKVISSYFQFYVNNLANSARKDMMFAWCFSRDPILATTITNTYTDILRIQQSPGWTYKMFSGTESGGSIYPSSGFVHIRIPRVMHMAHKLEIESSDSLDHSYLWETDVETDTSPAEKIYLNIVCMSTGDNEFAPADFQIFGKIYQKVKITHGMSEPDLLTPLNTK